MATQITSFISATEFDPMLARLVKNPPRPLPRRVLRLSLLLFASLVGWSIIGQLDIVAVAHGRLIPKTHVKIVQPSEAGIIRDIYVQEGERVKAGQILIRMDSTLSGADLTALRSEYARNQLTLQRIDAELGDRPLRIDSSDEQKTVLQVQAQYTANRDALEAALAQEHAGYERARQEMQAAQQTREKLALTLPMYRTQELAYNKLTEEGHTSKLVASEKSRERIEKEHDLKTQHYVIERERANMEQSVRKRTQIKSEYIRRLRNEYAETSDRLEKLAQELAKQDHRNRLLELTAPQDGRVKDLATHTTGTVTQPGTILMTLVPDNDALLAELWLANSDVGFVRPGQQVKLKLAAFQFQKYGMLQGRIEQIAADATEQEQLADGSGRSPMTYRTRVSLQQQALQVDGIDYPIAAGMRVTGDIKLGERRIAEYLLSPIKKAWHEAGRER